MTDRELRACTASAWVGEAWRCRWCGGELFGRRTRWCSDDCSLAFSRNHFWTSARHAAMKRDGFVCVRAGCESTRGLQVHHLTPVLGKHAVTGCHHLDGLETLCHEHHVEAHSTPKSRARKARGRQLRLEA